MHILELPSFFPPHGGLFCLEQAKALKQAGHEVRIVSIVELSITTDRWLYLTAPWREERREMDGIEVFSQYMRAVPKAVHRNVGRWISLCCEAVERYVRRYGKPDVLHAHCCKSAGMAARELSRRLGIPFFITEHIPKGLFERDFGEGWRRHKWLRDEMKEAYEAAERVVPVSRELVDDLAPFFGRAYQYQAISNIIDTDFYSYRERLPLSGRPFRFCCLAVADIHRKGYDVLAEAMKHLGNDVELHIAGQGTDKPALRQLFANRQNVRFHGELDRFGVRRLLLESDALVLPSRSEVQPLVLLEALSTGIPAVATECVGPSARLAVGCRYVPVGDACALAEAMKATVSIKPSPEFSEAVRSIASPQVVAKKLTALFEDAIGRYSSFAERI